MSAEPTDRISIDAAFQMLLPVAVKPREARGFLNNAISAGRVALWADDKEVPPEFFDTHLTVEAKSTGGRWIARLAPTKAVFDTIDDFNKTAWKVSRPDVVRLFEELKEPELVSSGRKTGPKVKFSWDSLVAEVMRRIYEDGLPDSDSALAAELATWCDKQRHKNIPEIDTIRRKLRIWLSRLPRE
jgi:hypothetical protein